jgi:methylamine dehydrogenase heavy chain
MAERRNQLRDNRISAGTEACRHQHAAAPSRPWWWQPSLAAGALIALLAAVPAPADVQPEPMGQVERLAQPFHAHWVWVSDLVLERAALIDLDSGRFLGLVNGGYGTIMPLFPAHRAEIYIPATYFSRRNHGDRTDVLEIYDAPTLSFVAEVPVPPQRATNAVAQGHAALSDDDRFVALFNWTTGQSLSIVDVAQRRFAGEIKTPGCSLVYAAGPRRFISVCGDGALLSVTLDDDGHELSRVRSAPFFDPQADPVTEKAVRAGNQWLFVSFEGMVHPVDVSGPAIRFGEAWTLVTDADRQETWRIGGLQHSAVHVKSGRFYTLMHRGGRDTHKDPGSQVWIFDLASHRRVQRIRLVNPGLTVYGFPLHFGRTWIRPFNHLSDWLLDTFAPAAVSAIQVTQDDAPRLFTASQFTGSLGVYDAMSGGFLGRVEPTGWTTDVLLAPWDGKGNP